MQSMACIASLRFDIGRHGHGRRAQCASLAPRQRACGHGSAAARGPRALDHGGGGGAFGALKALVRLACLGLDESFLVSNPTHDPGPFPAVVLTLQP